MMFMVPWERSYIGLLNLKISIEYEITFVQFLNVCIRFILIKYHYSIKYTSVLLFISLLHPWDKIKSLKSLNLTSFHLVPSMAHELIDFFKSIKIIKMTHLEILSYTKRMCFHRLRRNTLFLYLGPNRLASVSEIKKSL